jgi:AraC family transcriptional regulator of adaptative response/methylated-DNA-[protein]-cysteine methyltransferase
MMQLRPPPGGCVEQDRKKRVEAGGDTSQIGGVSRRSAMSSHQAIARAIQFIDREVESQPDLAAIAAVAGMSQFHCQRVFSELAGVSPKKFLSYLTLDRAKRALAESKSVLDASYEAGLSGPGRLHDLFVTAESVTPGEFKSHGAGLEIRHGIGDSPFGPALVLWTERGITGFAFLIERERDAAFAELLLPYRAARFVADEAAARSLVARIFAPVTGVPAAEPKLRLLLAGTPFQLKVWEALLKVPAGALVTYAQIARQVCTARASRAVGNAVGANLISYLVPCHRVIRGTGAFGNYRWGRGTKTLLLGAEAALAEGQASGVI